MIPCMVAGRNGICNVIVIELGQEGIIIRFASPFKVDLFDGGTLALGAFSSGHGRVETSKRIVIHENLGLDSLANLGEVAICGRISDLSATMLTAFILVQFPIVSEENLTQSRAPWCRFQEAYWMPYQVGRRFCCQWRERRIYSAKHCPLLCSWDIICIGNHPWPRPQCWGNDGNDFQ